jgi:protein-S-isoprenylcysteine O-methyltransferase Ste14
MILVIGSAGALIVFAVSTVSRLIHLRLTQQIRASTLGQPGKPRPVAMLEWLVWGLTLVFILLWVTSFRYWFKALPDWPAPVRLLLPLTDAQAQAPRQLPLIQPLGVVISWLGSVLFVVAVLNMGQAWRVGIDMRDGSALVTHGLFALSRNPIYVAFRLLFLGACLTWPGLSLGLVALGAAVCLHQLTRYEEAYLTDRFGAAYRAYCARTPRYLLPDKYALASRLRRTADEE